MNELRLITRALLALLHRRGNPTGPSWDLLRQQISVNIAMTSSLRRLPAEVLALIFDAVLQEHDPFARPTVAAGSIMRVCHSWAFVIYGMRHVWRHLCGGCADGEHDHSVARLRARAQLARPYPLRMRWWISAERDLEDVLVEYAGHWEYLELSGSWLELSSLPELWLPRLRGLDIFLHGPASPAHLAIVESAPLLQRLVLEALPPYGGSDDGREDVVRSFPFFHRTAAGPIAHLSLDLSISPLLSAVKQLLYDCRQSLVELRISGDVTWDCSLEGSGPIRMRALEGMELGWEACQLTGVAAAPKLCRLAMSNFVAEEEDGGGGADNVFKAVLALFRDGHIAPTLGRLKLQSVDSAFPKAEADFDRLASLMANLEELIVDNSERVNWRLSSFDGVISRLQCCRSVAPCFPSMTHLTVLLGKFGASSMTHRLLCEVVRSRGRPHVCSSLSVAQLTYVTTDVRSGLAPSQAVAHTTESLDCATRQVR